MRSQRSTKRCSSWLICSRRWRRDGAVVMSSSHWLQGFGGMISGRLPDIGSVRRALDLEAREVVGEETGTVGARHRAA
jgi:hypothetical protein